MDRIVRGLWRALWLCCGLGVSLVAVEAHASGSVPPSAAGYVCGGYTGATPQAACQGFVDFSANDLANRMSGDRFPGRFTIVESVVDSCNPTGGVGGGGACSAHFILHDTFDSPTVNTAPQTLTVDYSAQPGACPANSTASGSVCMCNDPYSPDSSGQLCGGGSGSGGNQCSAGAQGTSNFTWGYTRLAPNAGRLDTPADMIGPITNPSGGNTCVNGCSVTVGPVVGALYTGLTPNAQGGYRISGDHVVTQNGTPCTVAPGSAADPAAPPRACDGYVGTVGGVVTCVATGPASSASSPPTASGGTIGNPAASSDGSKTLGDPSRTPPGGGGTASGGPATPCDGTPTGGTCGKAGSAATPGTGASGGGSGTTGTNGKNEDGGECQKNPSAAGCGGTPGAVGTLYTKKTATFGEAMTSFKDQVQGSQIGTATSGFFTVTGGGTCPTFSAHIPYINADLNIDQFCSDFATGALSLFKAALLVVAGIAAFRVAML